MTHFRKFLIGGLVICMTGISVGAKSTTFVPTTVPDPEPQVEQRSFKIADGFEINLFASDPMIEKPIQMNWDAKGRLWCATSSTYPQLVPGQSPKDKIIILEDTTGSGRADKSTIFAEGLFISTSVVPGDGGAYVANSTELLHLKDTKGTGKSDARRVVFAGFGTEDTHHVLHTLHWGPDGRLYFIQSIYIHSHLETPHGLRTLLGSGVWRCDTRTLDLNVYSRGLVNPWGILWDRWGQSFETDGAGGEGVNYAFPGIGFFTAVGLDRLMKGLNPGSPKYASEEILSGVNMPDDYQGDILTNDFRANRIVRFKLSENGAGYTSKQMPDFLVSTDPAFRPVDLKMGPDGAIYIADWYNPIIQHGEVDFRDPRRDHAHGRIWRVTAKGRPIAPRPQLDGATIPQLLSALKASDDWTRVQAKLVLRERDPAEVLPALKSWFNRLKSSDPQADHHRVEALWTCENINTVDREILDRVLKADDPHARAAAVRTAGHWAGQLQDPLALIEPMVQDESPKVRLEAVRALAEVKSPQAVAIAARVLDKPMDPFLDYALWLTCKELEPIWIPAFQAGRLTEWAKPAHLNFALRAANSPAAVKTLVEQLKSGQTPADSRAGAIHLIANIGAAPEAAVLFDLAIKKTLGATVQTDLLSALHDLAKKHVVPPDPARLGDLVNDADESARAEALRLSGAWKLPDLRPQLIETAQAAQSSEKLRAAAIDGLAEMADAPSVDALRKLASPPSTPDVRRAAVVGLAAVDVKDAAARAADLFAAGDPNPASVLAGFSSREGGPAALAGALSKVKLPADTAKLALRYLRGTTTQDPHLTDVLSAAAGASSGPVRLTPEQMKQTIDEVLAKGDAARGEKIFRRSDTSCYQCHSIDGAGGWLAPDLSSIGASSPVDYLVNAVLDPNKDIKDGYDGYTVVTKSGDVVSGIKITQDNLHIVLRDNAHMEIPIALTDVKVQKPIGSLMPNGLADVLTHEEFIDLIRFLSELGKPGPYASSPAQYIRRWRVIDPAPSETSEGVVAALMGKDWPPAYSLVSGALPVTAIAPTGKRMGMVQGEVNVTAAGKIRFALNDAKGVSIWVDGKSVLVSGEMVLELPAGIHTLTAAVDANQRGDEGLRIEVADVPGSPGRAQPVGGK